jgi:hydroxyethylthiazole kinase-like sugar kinase family protein
MAQTLDAQANREHLMKIVTAAGLIAGSVAAATLGLSHPALAAPAGPSSAQDTVDALNAAGYRVVLNKVGAGSLNACAVTSIRKVRPSPRSMSPQQGRPAEATTAV